MIIQPTLSKKRASFYIQKYFDVIFDESLKNGFGEIELRSFSGQNIQEFFDNTYDAASRAYDLSQGGFEVYYSINPRVGGGKKENIKYMVLCHAEIDYGTTGHKKPPKHTNKEKALTAIQEFKYKPTIIVGSGGGLHCYWILEAPIEVESVGVETFEQVNKSLSEQLGGDIGTQDISRVLRVPGTYNFKIPCCPRPVSIITDNGPKYTFSELAEFVQKSDETNNVEPSCTAPDNKSDDIDIDDLAIPDRYKMIILRGNKDEYESRSEADMAVIMSLVQAGLPDSTIKLIYGTYAIGAKYREHKSPAKYLDHNIRKARSKVGVSESQIQEPLCAAGVIRFANGKPDLDIFNLQEFSFRENNIKYREEEDSFYQYDGKCYVCCKEEKLNGIIQHQLGGYRRLFRKNCLTEVLHFAKGDQASSSSSLVDGQAEYLTFENGLFNISAGQLTPHTPAIFTKHRLSYIYDPEATCLRFRRFLYEVFDGNEYFIILAQEAVGYALHRSIPTAVLFFLIGDGSNGKSVFLKIIRYLFGEENAASVNLAQLSKENFLPLLQDKMVNISAESPAKKRIDTELIKAVTSGDTVTGKELYENPTDIESFAKHFIAMNEVPLIADSSHGMWRRIKFLVFPKTFSGNEIDPTLTETLQSELPGIFNWAYEGYLRLKKNNFIFTESDESEDKKREMLFANSNVKAFAEMHFEKSTDKSTIIELKDAYASYATYCQTYGVNNPEKKSDFKMILMNLGYNVFNSTKHGNKLIISGAKFK